MTSFFIFPALTGNYQKGENLYNSFPFDFVMKTQFYYVTPGQEMRNHDNGSLENMKTATIPEVQNDF